MRLGILPLGRTTFDVPFAEANLAAMLAALDATGHQIVGPRHLLCDADASAAATDDLAEAGVDRLLVLQVTFTDAAATVIAAEALPAAPLAIWAVPEPRRGGRLRLNAFCGLNLASHALGLSGRRFGWLYADPAGDDVAGDLGALLDGNRDTRPRLPVIAGTQTPAAEAIRAAVAGKRIARLGDHPVGFDTCAYDADAIKSLAGVGVDALDLTTLFDTARGLPKAAASGLRADAEQALAGLDTVDPDQLDRSLRLKLALDEIRTSGRYDAFAIRCWPETFTDYGGAVCGPVSMLGEARVPCACEADVMGALTQLVLQETAQAPVFLTDLVDVDTADNSAVVWHCGQAPASMRAGPATATIHTNRKMPLLYEFSLRPGPVTLMRLSQARGTLQMILAGAEVLDRPMAFTGTSGVLRFDGPADAVATAIMNSGLEHHMALVYGDHMGALMDVAAAFGLPVQDLGT